MNENIFCVVSLQKQKALAGNSIPQPTLRIDI
jgi:hypothetical protein